MPSQANSISYARIFKVYAVFKDQIKHYSSLLQDKWIRDQFLEWELSKFEKWQLQDSEKNYLNQSHTI